MVTVYKVFDRSSNHIGNFSSYSNAIKFINSLDGIDFYTIKTVGYGSNYKQINEIIVNEESRKIVFGVIEDLFEISQDIQKYAEYYNDDIFRRMIALFERVVRHAELDFSLTKCIKYMKDVVTVVEESSNPWKEEYSKKLEHIKDKANGVITMLILEYGGNY